jgi:hypothetical protein
MRQRKERECVCVYVVEKNRRSEKHTHREEEEEEIFIYLTLSLSLCVSFGSPLMSSKSRACALYGADGASLGVSHGRAQKRERRKNARAISTILF